MPYPYDQIIAADPSNPERVAANGVVTIFAPGDTTQTPLTITTLQGLPLENPIKVNEQGYGKAFMHATLDQVAWSGAGFTGLFVSYKGLKEEAVAARQDAGVAASAALNVQAKAEAGEFVGKQGAQGKQGDQGLPGANALPTATAVAEYVRLPGPVKEALKEYAPDGGGKPVGKGELFINVKDYGARGNASADDTAAVQAAVTEANRVGAILFWPNGGYKTVESITGLHSARHRGNGYVVRDGVNFFLEPKAGNVNTLHVAPEASPSADGLSARHPRGVQQAFDALSNYGPVLGGQWTIQHAPGTYPGGYGLPRIMSRAKIKVQGPSMGGPRIAPTAIYDRGSSTVDWGIYTVDRAQVSFSDLAFVNFNRTTINSGGIRVGEYNSVDLWNIHTDNCELGFFAMDHVVYNFGGSHFKNSTYAGIHELYMVLRNSSALTMEDRTIIEGGKFGIKAKELNTGHMDRTEFISNDYAIHLSRNSTMNFSYSIFRRNKNCVVVAGSSTFVDLYTTFGTGPERNTVKYRYMDGAANVAQARTENALSAPYVGMSEKSMAYGTMPGKHQGTTNDTQLVPLGKFLSGDFQGQGAWIRWEAYGSANLSTVGTLRLRVGGQGVATITMPTGIYNFKFDGRMYVTADGDTQRADSMLTYSTGHPIFGGGNRTVPIGTVSTDSAIGIFMALGAAVDSIQVDQAALFTSDL